MARKKRNIQTPLLPGRRTLTVWASLVGSLSVLSGLLFLLDPTPSAPAVGPILSMLSSPTDMRGLLEPGTGAASRQWKAITIHHSGRPHGNAETLGKRHQEQGYGGLGFHFVIGNGDGSEDGEIRTGYRWMRQLDGIHHKDTIEICLIGNGDKSIPSELQMQQLVNLVRALQSHYELSADAVWLYRETNPDVKQTSPGVLFPATQFRSQLSVIGR